MQFVQTKYGNEKATQCFSGIVLVLR